MENKIMTIGEKDLSHVIRMVLNDNKGNVITEAIVLGVEQSIMFYMKTLPNPVVEKKDGNV